MQISPNQLNPDQDQRKNSSMEDSTSMTIEFLRARLLSERSVSRTARQRADELAKRVLELEVQLKTVSLQRKKAEKAAADVLSILENRGLSDFSEEFDSSSDQEVVNCECKVGNNFLEEEESSVGRSLSWKSGKDCLHSREKRYMDSPTRRRSISASTASASPRRRMGKSCRQIRRRETRSVVEESQSDNSMVAPQHNGVETCSECFPTHSDVGAVILREGNKQDANKFLGGPVSGDLESQRTVANASNYLNVNGSEKDMERALEHQAQLIGQYEEEEKAQREWEEKFRENNSSTPDSCERGNQSDFTEERDEPKAHAPPCHVGTMASQDQEAKSKVEDACLTKESSNSKSLPNGFHSPPRVDLGRFHDKKPQPLDFKFPVASAKQNQQHGDHHHPHLEGPTTNQTAHIFPSHASSSSHKGEMSGSKNDHYELIPHETVHKLGSVLDALHQAKLSLKHKVNNALPPIVNPSVGDRRAEVPVGCVGLFRLPSDFHSERTGNATFPGSNSQLCLTNYSHPDTRTAQTVVDDIANSSVSTGNRNLAIPTTLYPESRSKNPTWESPETWSRFSYPNPFRGPSLGTTGLPSSSNYSYNEPNINAGHVSSSSTAYASPVYPLYQDLMPQMPSNDGSRLFSSVGAGIPPPNRFSFYGDNIRPNMYR